MFSFTGTRTCLSSEFGDIYTNAYLANDVRIVLACPSLKNPSHRAPQPPSRETRVKNQPCITIVFFTPAIFTDTRPCRGGRTTRNQILLTVFAFRFPQVFRVSAAVTIGHRSAAAEAVARNRRRIPCARSPKTNWIKCRRTGTVAAARRWAW